MIHEHAAHRLGGQRKEVVAVVHRLQPTGQPQVRLVYQSGRLQGVIAPLAPHVGASGTTQFSLDGLEETLAIVGRAGPPSPKQGRQIVS